MTDKHVDTEEFSAEASALTAFGQRFGLHVDKFSKGSSNRDFAFRHPEGGVGLLQQLES